MRNLFWSGYCTQMTKSSLYWPKWVWGKSLWFGKYWTHSNLPQKHPKTSLGLKLPLLLILLVHKLLEAIVGSTKSGVVLSHWHLAMWSIKSYLRLRPACWRGLWSGKAMTNVWVTTLPFKSSEASLQGLRDLNLICISWLKPDGGRATVIVQQVDCLSCIQQIWIPFVAPHIVPRSPPVVILERWTQNKNQTDKILKKTYWRGLPSVILSRNICMSKLCETPKRRFQRDRDERHNLILIDCMIIYYLIICLNNLLFDARQALLKSLRAAVDGWQMHNPAGEALVWVQQFKKYNEKI